MAATDREVPSCPDCKDSSMVGREVGRRTGWFYCDRCGTMFQLDEHGAEIRIVRK